MQTQRIEKLVIVGGGTAGWMTAANLKHHFKEQVSITLVESSALGTVGVGEATIPTIRHFYRQLGMTDTQVIQATQATCKLGIQFNDWHKTGSSFIHPFGLFGQDLRGIGFHHFWLKLKQKNRATSLQDYSLGVNLAKYNKFTLPSPTPSSTLSVFDWALHFDAVLFAKHLREFALKQGVKHIDATINRVDLRETDGFIESLTLHSGEKVHGDLFIDCSGFRGLLIEEALHTGYENWSQWLLCDGAFAVQTESTGQPAPYTKVTAHTAGWQWRIPLQHRAGNGHVFSSRFMGDDQAKTILLQNLDGKPLFDPRKIAFTPGRRTKAWNKNCIAVGLSSGFLEPLESTSIALVETAIEKIKMLFPDKSFNPRLIEEFNSMTAEEYERVRDFIILHYKASARDDSEFWRYCRAMEIPDSLQYKIELYRARGHFVRYRWEMFGNASWLAIYDGFNIQPDIYDPAVDAFSEDYLANTLDEMKLAIRNAVEGSPDHAAFIARYCAANSAKTSFLANK